MKKRGMNRGITIIVLIITIVVMFILAAVSVNLIIKTDIFNSAKGAVKKTNGKVAETETQVNELLNEWERLNAEWGDNTTPGGNTNPETCSHIWGTWSTIKAATCTEAGSRKTTCTKCNETKTETLEALGHNFVNGSCTRCGITCEHTYGEWKVTKEATCTEGGSQKRECSKCGNIETENISVKDHNWNTETGTCKDCGTTCTHSYGSWSTTTAATCTAAGSKSKTCSVCKHVETESIAATGHSWNASTGNCNTCGTACTHTYGDWTITAPATCTIAGSKYRTCSTCKYKDVQSIAVLGHDYEEYVCIRCGAEDPNKPVTDGRYVKYDVAYTDVYNSKCKYTAISGWRLLKATSNGDGTYKDVELISTGIPVKFSYYYYNEASWWVTDSNMLTKFKNILRRFRV